MIAALWIACAIAAYGFVCAFHAADTPRARRDEWFPQMWMFVCLVGGPIALVSAYAFGWTQYGWRLRIGGVK